MEITSERFLENARGAIENEPLQKALSQAAGRFDVHRRHAFEAFPEGEALRDRARDIKTRTLASLDRHLGQLADSVERLGGQVHWAADAAEARRIIVELIRARQARLVVKSKSMTTEEIGLNGALESAGVETIETDLGEYIIQLAGEAPFHIIAPALHKTREEVTQLFVDKLGAPRLENRQDLMQEARRRLRESFGKADVGITGVNFAVAETGSIAVVENEGNARLTTSLPKVHIAVMGMEKVIPDLESLAVFLKILARSATGQKMSSYVSVVSGPAREDEEDGPEEFHLVVLDNGRSRLLADPELRESLNCIRCGACLNVCPVYRRAGGHSYGWVYSGPIGAVINPTLIGADQAAQLPFASSLCGACRDVCPVRIDLPRMLLAQRQRVIAEGKARRGLPERLAVRGFVSSSTSAVRYRWANRILYWVSRLFSRRSGWWRPPLAAGWTGLRDAPVPSTETFRQRWQRNRRS